MVKGLAVRVDVVAPDVELDPLLDRNRPLLVDRLDVEVVAHLATLGHHLDLHCHQVVKARNVQSADGGRLGQSVELGCVEELDLGGAEEALQGPLRLVRDSEGTQPTEHVPELAEIDCTMEEKVEIAAFAVAEVYRDPGTAAEVELRRKTRGEDKPGLGRVRRQDATDTIG
jgi:hypothetical protein